MGGIGTCSTWHHSAAIRGSGLIAEVLAARLWRPGMSAPVISPTIEVRVSRLRPREWGSRLRESCGLTIDQLGPHVLLLFLPSTVALMYRGRTEKRPV